MATFDAVGSRLQGHPDMLRLPGLDMSTGSLGMGISAGVGVALGARLAGHQHRDHHAEIMGDAGAAFIDVRLDGAHLFVFRVVKWIACRKTNAAILEAAGIGFTVFKGGGLQGQIT